MLVVECWPFVCCMLMVDCCLLMTDHFTVFRWIDELLNTSCWLVCVGCWLLSVSYIDCRCVGYGLLVVGYWSLDIGY